MGTMLGMTARKFALKVFCWEGREGTNVFCCGQEILLSEFEEFIRNYKKLLKLQIPW